MKLVNYSSGELLIADDDGRSVRLAHEAANRLVMYARMHTAEDFVEALPRLLPNADLVQSLRLLFTKGETSSDRWNLKEKFARLHTWAKGFQAMGEEKIIEEIEL